MKILIAEDNPVTKELLSTILEKMGHEVVAVTDGLEAWKIYQESDINVIITDWLMPNMDGLSLCKKIRSTPNKTYIYIIVLTAKDQKQDLINVLESGADDYICKPFDPAELRVRVKTSERIIQLEEGHKRAKETLQKRTDDLRERVKQLRCLYGIAKLIEQPNISLEETIQGSVDLISPSMKHPEITCARITLEGKEFRTENFKEGFLKYASEIFAHGERIGLVEIYHLVEISESSDTTFTNEEKALVDVIVKRLGRLIERIKAEEDLKMFRSLVNQSNDAIVVVDPHTGGFIDVNLKACESLGYSKEELLSKKVTDILCNIVDLDGWANHVHELRREGMALIYDHSKRKDGTTYPVEVNIRYVVQNNKEYLVSTARDITERKRAEEERQKIESQLLQSEKMASIGQLAAGVAHEINNPTSFVNSNLNTLSDYFKDMNSLIIEYKKLVANLEGTMNEGGLPQLSEQIERIKTLEDRAGIDLILNDVSQLIDESREGTERIKRIVNDLKDFAHPSEDKAEYIDLNKNLDSTLNVVWNELKYKAKVIKDYGDLPEVKCYPQQLSQVFANILVNAAQAIEKDGEIRIATNSGNGYVEIAISDTGVGIPEENISKIFEPFFTTKEVGKGTGLGLHVAYNIIKKHGGTIDVKSETGKGATFIVRINRDSII